MIHDHSCEADTWLESFTWGLGAWIHDRFGDDHQSIFIGNPVHDIGMTNKIHCIIYYHLYLNILSLHTYIYIYIYVYAYAYVYVYVYVYLYVYVYTYIHMYMYLYTCTYTYVNTMMCNHIPSLTIVWSSFDFGLSGHHPPMTLGLEDDQEKDFRSLRDDINDGWLFGKIWVIQQNSARWTWWTQT